MDDGRPYAKDSHSDDGGLTEAIAPAHGDNAKDAYRQVAKPTSSWKGLPVGQPMDSATESEMKK
jgi:hypothetical protein